MNQSNLWEVVPASGEAETALGTAVPEYSEWLRLLVGRSLAFSQLSETTRRYEYLVLGSGRNLLKPKGDAAEKNSNAARDAVEADFEILRKLHEYYKGQISDGAIDAPERFLQSFTVLAMLRLPEGDEDWRVTDEGLTIVNWGLTSGRRWFEWNIEKLNQQRAKVLARYGWDGLSSGTNASAERQLNSAANAIAGDRKEQNSGVGHDSGPSPRGPVSTTPRVSGTFASLFVWMKTRALSALRSKWLKILAISACAVAALLGVMVVRDLLSAPGSVAVDVPGTPKATKPPKESERSVPAQDSDPKKPSEVTSG